MHMWKSLLTAVALTLAALSLVAVPTPAQAQRGKNKEPTLEVTKSGRKNPKQQPSNAARRILGKIIDAYNDDKYDVALAEIEKLLANPRINNFDRSKAYQIKSNILYGQDDNAGALEAAKQAIAADGLSNLEHLELKLFVAQLHSLLEQPKEAIAAWNDWAVDAPSINGDQYALQAQNYYEAEDFAKAIEFIDKAIAAGPEAKDSWYSLKYNAFVVSENFDGLLAYTEQLTKQFPGNGRYAGWYVGALIEKERYPDALAVLEGMKAAGTLKEETQWKQFYQLYLYVDKPLESARVIEEGLANGALKPSCALAIDLGENYYSAATAGAQQDRALLQKAYDAYASGFPICEEGTPWLWTCQIDIEREQYAQAREHCTSALAKGNMKQTGNAHYLLCVAEYELNNTAAARQACTAALGFSESKRNAEQLLKSLR